MNKLSKKELLAVLAIAGVTGAGVHAADTASDQGGDAFKVIEHPSMSRLGSDEACGKGACGKDEKGAEAAKKKKEDTKAKKGSGESKSAKSEKDSKDRSKKSQDPPTESN